MWNFFLKLLPDVALLIPLLSVLAANVIPFLNYRQSDGKNKNALLDTLARELDKVQPCGYLVESCVSRLHNIRPLPWAFLKAVLPCCHSLEIIRQVSFGRQFLDLFDITVEGGRPVVKYAAALSSSTLRTGTMVACGLLFVFFMGLLLHTEGQLLDIIYANKPDNAAAGDILSKLFQMVLWGGVGCVFSVQGLILKRSKERLERIAALIEESFPSAGSEPGPEGTSVTA